MEDNFIRMKIPRKLEKEYDQKTQPVKSQLMKLNQEQDRDIRELALLEKKK